MKIIDWINSHLTNGINSSQQVIDNVSDIDLHDLSNTITFGLDPSDHPWIFINLNHNNTVAAEYFAKMLVKINNGSFQKSIIELLVKLVEEQPNLANMVESILIHWGSQSNPEPQNYTDNNPIVSPRQAFLDSQPK